MNIKNLIAGMLTVVMLAGPGTMTCYAAGSSEANAVSVNAASTEETADSAAAKEAPAVSPKGEESKADDSGAYEHPDILKIEVQQLFIGNKEVRCHDDRCYDCPELQYLDRG